MALHISPLLILLSLLSCPATMARIISDVTRYGAIPDGETDATKPFLDAWDAACSNASIDGRPSTVVVPKGRYSLDRILFSGPCVGQVTVVISAAATLLAPSPFIVDGNKWIEFKSVDGLLMIGGTFDGRGEALWKCKAEEHEECPAGATSLSITKSNNVRLRNLTFVDSEHFHLGIRNSTYVTVAGVNIDASEESPNTDGIHVEYSSYVSISDAIISTGDDCISLSHQSKHVVMDGVFCGPGHGVSIGSLGEDPNLEEEVYNITGKNIVFQGTQNGLRIKTWPTTARGWIRSVSFRNITMVEVSHPIIVVQNYCDHRADKRECEQQANSQIAISHLSYVGVQGTSTHQVGVKFNCSEARPCTDVTLRDIDLLYVDDYSGVSKEITAECINVWGRSSGVMHPPSCFNN